MAELDLNLLRVFDALLQAGSVTGAADRLNLSIPATSRALGRLRRAMQDPILVRAGRGMTATPFAQLTAPRVRSLIDEADALTRGERDIHPAELTRSFAIRINDGLAALLTTAAVEAVSRSAPGVTLRFLQEENESAEAIRDGTVDLDVGVGDEPARDLRTAVLYRESMVGIVRADSPLGRHRRPTLKQLCEYPHVSASRRGRTRGPLDDALEAAGLQRRVAAVVPGFAVAALLIASSDLVGLIPRRLAVRYAETLGIRWFPIAAPLPEPDVRLAWHARFDADPTHRWLRETIRAAIIEP